MRSWLFLFLLPLALSAQEFSISESKTMKDQADFVRCVRFSPFGNYIAVSLGNNTLELYDKNWNKLYTTQGDPKSFSGQCVFSPDERLLIFSKYRNKSDIAVYSISENRIVQSLQDHGQMIYGLALSPDGRHLATGGADETLMIYTLQDNLFQIAKKVEFEREPQAMAFSPDSKELVVGIRYDGAVVFSSANGNWTKTQLLKEEKTGVERVAFNPTGKNLATSTNNGSIVVYEKKGTDYVKSQLLTDLGRDAQGLAFSPDGEYLVGGLQNGCIQIWQHTKADTLKKIKEIYRHDGNIFDVDFSPDGKSMSTSGLDKTGIIWTLEGIKPSAKSIIGNILGSDITQAQRKILSGNIPSTIIAAIEPDLLLPKDEFETNMDFLKRKEKLKSKLTSLIQEQMEAYYHLNKEGATLETNLDKVVSYDADGQQYFILFMQTAGKVKMPANEAKSLKENWKKAKVTLQKSRDKNGENAYKKFILKHPQSGKAYEIEINENPFIPGSSNLENARSSNTTIQVKTLTMMDTSAQFKNYGGHNYALLFATNDYDNYSDLVNPVYDAKTVAEELQRNYGFTTELVENATLDVILKKLKRYAQLSYDKEDQLFIFFAGHGKYDEIFREGYLVAKESKLQDDARTTFLSHSNLRTIVNNIDCQHIFLTMDVCFGGTFDPYLAAHRGDEVYEEVAKTEFIERKMKHKTRLYLTSGGKEYVPDGRPGEHSPFARKLLEALRSYGGKDGILTVSEIISYVEKVVPQPRTGEFGNNEPGSDFVFIAK